MLHEALLSIVLAAAASNETAQATKLAQAIATGRGFSAAQVYVGKLPPGKTFGAPLPRFPLVGSVVQDSGPRSGITVYYDLPTPESSALDAYGKQLQQSGWKESATVQRLAQSETSRGGFAVTPRVPAVFPHMYCKAGAGVLMLQRLQGMPVIALTTSTSAESAMFCTMADAVAQMIPPSPPPLPSLKAPANVTMEEKTQTWSGQSSDALLTTSQPIANVGAQFAQQFASAGWTPDAPAQSAAGYLQTFRLVRKDHRYQAILTLVSSGKRGQYDASLEERDLDAKDENAGFSIPFVTPF